MTNSIEARNIQKTFKLPNGKSLTILHNINISLKQGEVVALIGQSGSGKSTLLQILGCLDKPTHGHVYIKGQAMEALNDTQTAAYRGQHIGFVYQSAYLLPEFTAEENVMLPQRLQGNNKKQSKERARALLEKVGLSHRYHHRPQQLSGGEQQRVAIARALANNPSLILADEPTGNLDSSNAKIIYALLLDMAQSEGAGVILATHDKDIKQAVMGVWHLKDGILTTES